MTQVDTAKAMGVAQCTVSLWETGNTHPTGRKLVALAELYGCTIDQLFESEITTDGKQQTISR